MREKHYDEIVAPMLLEVARKCEELGMTLVARVEWEPGEAGITKMGDTKVSAGQFITEAAALCRGNIDAMLLHLIRNFDVSQSIFLYQHNRAAVNW